MSKPILCLDFDGVLHSYTSGWQGADVIPDPPVQGAFHFVLRAQKHFDVHVYSSRSGQRGGREAMINWFVDNGFPLGRLEPLIAGYDGPMEADRLKFPLSKPPAFLSIDDRAITFEGYFPDPEALLSFKPWNKR